MSLQAIWQRTSHVDSIVAVAGEDGGNSLIGLPPNLAKRTHERLSRYQLPPLASFGAEIFELFFVNSFLYSRCNSLQYFAHSNHSLGGLRFWRFPAEKTRTRPAITSVTWSRPTAVPEKVAIRRAALDRRERLGRYRRLARVVTMHLYSLMPTHRSQPYIMSATNSDPLFVRMYSGEQCFSSGG